jgi:hypothetical protein
MDRPPLNKEQSEPLYILQDRDGDYVASTESSDTETVKIHFTFTKDKAKVKRFTANDLWSPLATTAIGIEFTTGFAGGKALRLEPESKLSDRLKTQKENRMNNRNVNQPHRAKARQQAKGGAPHRTPRRPPRPNRMRGVGPYENH